MAEALTLLGAKRAFVVSSNDGMDEVSVSDVTHYAKIENGIHTFELFDPQEYGIKLSSFCQIKGADAKKNATITLDILKGYEKDAKRDIVVVNSAFALVANGDARDIQDGLEMAREAIDSKKCEAHLKKIIEISNKL